MEKMALPLPPPPSPGGTIPLPPTQPPPSPLENEFVDLMREAISSDNLTKVGEFLNINFNDLSNLESWITKSNTMPVNIKAITLLIRGSIKEYWNSNISYTGPNHISELIWTEFVGPRNTGTVLHEVINLHEKIKFEPQNNLQNLAEFLLEQCPELIDIHVSKSS